VNLITLHRVINYLYFSLYYMHSEGCRSDSPMCVKLFIGRERNVVVYEGDLMAHRCEVRLQTKCGDRTEKINCFQLGGG